MRRWTRCSPTSEVSQGSQVALHQPATAFRSTIPNNYLCLSQVSQVNDEIGPPRRTPRASQRSISAMRIRSMKRSSNPPATCDTCDTRGGGHVLRGCRPSRCGASSRARGPSAITEWRYPLGCSGGRGAPLPHDGSDQPRRDFTDRKLQTNRAPSTRRSTLTRGVSRITTRD